MSKSVINIILGGSVGALVSFGVLYPQIQALEERMAQAPKIIVIDDADLAFSINKAGTSPEVIDQYFKKVHSIKKELVLQGYTVLNADAVSAVDDSLVLSPDDLKELLKSKAAATAEEP